MKKRLASIIFLLLIAASLSSAGGAAESASADRGEYLAAQGKVIPPNEIHVDSYVSRINFGYQDPVDPLGVTFLCTREILSSNGQETIIQIGIQGMRSRFEEVPPLNLSFVFDASGSMSAGDKIAWVRRGLEVLISRLRSEDVLSVVAYTSMPTVVIPPTPVADIEPDRAMEMVRLIHPVSVAFHDVGLEAGVEQIERFFDPSRVNRIIILTDGLGENEGLKEIAEKCRGNGIGITAIGVGTQIDLTTIEGLARSGGGSSRFLSSWEKITDNFDTELDRMVVPVATDLEIDLDLMEGAEVLDAWGYGAIIRKGGVSFTHPTVHNRDYETILVRVKTPPGVPPGMNTMAHLTLSYKDVIGNRRPMQTYTLNIGFEDLPLRKDRPTQRMAVISETILHAAVALERIGTLYFTFPGEQADSRRLSDMAFSNRSVSGDGELVQYLARSRQALDNAIMANKRYCLDLSMELRREIISAHEKLGEQLFESELRIFDKYIELFSRELGIQTNILERMIERE